MRKAKIDNCRDVMEVDIENFENMLVNAMKSILFKSNYYLIDSDSNPLKYFLCEHHYCAICFEKYWPNFHVSRGNEYLIVFIRIWPLLASFLEVRLADKLYDRALLFFPSKRIMGIPGWIGVTMAFGITKLWSHYTQQFLHHTFYKMTMFHCKSMTPVMGH